MKTIIAAILLTLSAAPAAARLNDCAAKGHRLYGRVKIVTSFPDVRVQVVDSFADLRVKRVSAFPRRCGEWQLVDAFPDVKVQLVDAFADVKISWVDAFPGIGGGQ